MGEISFIDEDLGCARALILVAFPPKWDFNLWTKEALYIRGFISGQDFCGDFSNP